MSKTSYVLDGEQNIIGHEDIEKKDVEETQMGHLMILHHKIFINTSLPLFTKLFYMRN